MCIRSRSLDDVHCLLVIGSNSGHIVVSILIDLQEFWTYENREVLLPDASAAAVVGAEASTKI